MGEFRLGMTLWAGKAMLMRGGACATELCLMMGCVCVIVSNWLVVVLWVVEVCLSFSSVGCFFYPIMRS